MRRATVLLLVAGAFAGAATAAPAPTPSGPCAFVASPAGDDDATGTEAAPLRTPQAVADRLGPGQTGCLRGGRYPAAGPFGYVVTFEHGGVPGRPLVLRSFPGERAVLEGVVVVRRTAPDVTLRDLAVDDRTPFERTGEITLTLNAARTTLDGLSVTNHNTRTCALLGSGGNGRAVGNVVRDTVFDGCGDPAHGLLDHALYVAHATGTRIVGNRIRQVAGYGVHLYPDAQRSVVRGNAITRTGGGVIFAGEGREASGGNVVTRNVIAAGSARPALSAAWGGRTGRGNAASRNCLLRGGAGALAGVRARGNVAGRGTRIDGTGRLVAAGACDAVLGRVDPTVPAGFSP